ncbi:MAG: DeoR/GlpR family DNA-binding transcription regulator [Kiloniellales bacterium]|nr:DeoR/GlpR family DNA-binding transcription regulator [Kiloniellales bacterium]
MEDRAVKAASVADELGVSTETIRRDLKQLESAGRLKRVYGGAVPLGRDIPPLHVRMQMNPDGTEVIAKVITRYVEQDQWVYLSGGSPLIPIARRLADGPRLRVMTHMPAVADALIGASEHEIHLTGGRYHQAHRILQGDAVFDAIDGRLFDLAILGVHGLCASRGLVDALEFLSRLKRRIMGCVRRCIWVCDSSGFNLEGHFLTAPLEAIDTLITDDRPVGGLMAAIEAAGVELIVANETNRTSDG